MTAAPQDPTGPGIASGATASLDELMAQALAIEIEAAERYGELADVMETHNNRDVAALFRRMQHIEGLHAAQIREEMGWAESVSPRVPAMHGGTERPETAAHDDIHYLMQPYHALAVALAAEERAERFFTELARIATVDSVREAAGLLAAEESEHVQLVREWMNKVPQPDSDWAVDPDPPRYID